MWTESLLLCERPSKCILLEIKSVKNKGLDKKHINNFSISGISKEHKNLKKEEKTARLTLFDASEERIAAVADRANANRIVIDYTALGIHAARAWTRILASLIDAGLARGAIRADYALRPTGRRTADVIGLTRADRVIVDNTAVAVRPTGLAHIVRHQRLCEEINRVTAYSSGILTTTTSTMSQARIPIST